MTTSERLRGAVLAILAGCIFVWFNFNGLIRNAVKGGLLPDSSFSRSIISVSLLPQQILGTSTKGLYLWLVFCFAGIWVYVGVILLLALVRRRVSLAGWGVGGLVGGGLAPALLSWAGLLVWTLFRGIAYVLLWIGHLFKVVLVFLGKLLVLAWPFLVVVALIGVLVWVWKTGGPKLLLLGTLGAAVFYFLIPVVKFLAAKLLLVLQWIGKVLSFLFGWLPAVLLWLAKAILFLLAIPAILGVLGCLGQLLISQLDTAIKAGRNQKAVFTASFSLGVSIALLLLVASGRPEAPVIRVPAAAPATARISAITAFEHTPSLAKAKKRKRRKSRKTRTAPIPPPAIVKPVAPAPPPVLNIAATIDHAWARSTFIFKTASPTRIFVAILPSGVQNWARRTFRSAGAPIVDAVTLGLVVILSLAGLLHGLLLRSERESRVRFYNSDLLLLVAIPFSVVLLVLSASQGNQD